MLLTFISCKKDHVTIQFDIDKEVSGMKVSLEDKSSGFPGQFVWFETGLF